MNVCQIPAPHRKRFFPEQPERLQSEIEHPIRFLFVPADTLHHPLIQSPLGFENVVFFFVEAVFIRKIECSHYLLFFWQALRCLF